jgi:hypothetical protein
MDLLTIYAHDSELQAITSPMLIFTIHKSSQRPLSPFSAFCVFTSRSLATASNSGDSSASRSQVLSSQPPVHNSPSTQKSQSYVTTDGQSASLLWCQAPIWDLRPDFFFYLIVACFLMWGALSDERTMYNIFTFYKLLHECMYNIYKASVSPGSVKQIMLSLVLSAYEF